jgi:hypothetical protein
MPIETQMATCTEQYSRWKRLALDAQSLPEVKEYLNKALFWLELQTAFVALWSIEQNRGKDPVVKHQLIIAKTNLSRKLADYAQKTLDEIKWK